MRDAAEEFEVIAKFVNKGAGSYDACILERYAWREREQR